MYGIAMRTPTWSAVSHGGGVAPVSVVVSVAIRDARMMIATAPKKRLMSVCARVGRRMARCRTLRKMRT